MVAFLAGALFVSCGDGEIPSRELSEAREQIALATEEGAQSHAPEELQGAEKALVEAHKSLAEEELEEATASAELAKSLAIKARSVSAPIYTDKQKEESEKAYSEAEQMKAAEIAPDEMAAAESSLEEGKMHQGQAEELAQKDNQVLAVSEYEKSYTAYNDAEKSAAEARSKTVSHKNELSFRAKSIEEKIQKAASYNAKANAKEPYEGAVKALSSAKSSIQDSQWDQAQSDLDRADSLADEAVSRSVVGYSQNRINEAEGDLKSAKEMYAKKSKEYSSSVASNQQVFSLTKDYLAAGDEALKSAKTNHQNKNYDRAVSEADEVINTARVVQERLAGLQKRPETEVAGTADDSEPTESTTSSESELAGDQTDDSDGSRSAAGEEADEDGSMTSSEEGELYTVQDRSPPDCLWCIAKKKYQKGSLWKNIFDANRSKIKNPDLIYPGQKLVIPPKE